MKALTSLVLLIGATTVSAEALFGFVLNATNESNSTDGNSTDNSTDGNNTDGNTTDNNTDGNNTDGNTTDGNTTDYTGKCNVSCTGTGCSETTAYAPGATFNCSTNYSPNGAVVTCPTTLGNFSITCVSYTNTAGINSIAWESSAAAEDFLRNSPSNIGGAYPPESCVDTCESIDGTAFGFDAGSGINCFTCDLTSRRQDESSFIVTCVGTYDEQISCLRAAACRVSMTGGCRVNGTDVDCPACDSGSKKGLLGLLGLLGLIPLFICLILCCVIIFCCCRRAKKTDGEVFVGTFTAPTADVCGVEMVSPYCGTGVVGTFGHGSQAFACP